MYFDHAATTPVRPEVRQAMEPFLWGNFANPSSIYASAQEARSALDDARDRLASLLGVRPGEVIFTSGGSESNNAAIKGMALARQAEGKHVITSAIEHHAVLHPIEELAQRFGYEVTVVPVGPDGLVDVAAVENAIRPDTVLASIMWANNEIGTIQPVEPLASMLHTHGVLFHVDAVQAVGVLPVNLAHIPVDALSLSAHKFYGPKGVGALVLRAGTPWWPLITGGGQERNRRAGTENVAGIVGMARALTLAEEERVQTVPRIRALRDCLLQEIENRLPCTVVNGDRKARLPGNVNVSFPGVHGESLLVGLDRAGIMASSGSACASGSTEPSHVLTALGLAPDLASASLRLTLGRENTRVEVDRLLQILLPLVSRLRHLAPAPS